MRVGSCLYQSREHKLFCFFIGWCQRQQLFYFEVFRTLSHWLFCVSRGQCDKRLQSKYLFSQYVIGNCSIFLCAANVERFLDVRYLIFNMYFREAILFLQVLYLMGRFWDKRMAFAPSQLQEKRQCQAARHQHTIIS
jgi:hypothetical protein